MNNHINELYQYPSWIDTMTTEDRMQWYKYIKTIVLPRLTKMGEDTTKLTKSIREFEIRNNIS